MKKGFVRLTIFAMVLVSLAACSRPASTDGGVDADKESVNFSGATQSMYKADYWLEKTKKQDEVIMTLEEIKAYNNSLANSSFLKYYNLDEYPESLDEQTLKSLLSVYSVPEGDRYIDGVAVTKAYKNKLASSRNLSAIKDDNQVRYGFVTRETALRDLPTDDVSNGEPDDVEFDMFFEGKLKVWERVAVVHTSLDGKWYYIQGVPYVGWIKASDVALTDRQTWSKYNDRDFLVVTANRITLDYDFDTSISRKEMLMGTRLPLGEKSDVVSGVSTQSSHTVLLPGRDENGMFVEKTARVPLSADVSVGYLPYTKKNVINQAYKMLGERYGWGGSLNARDCSLFLRDIFYTFGVELPRNSASQASIPSKTKVDVSQMNDGEKEAVIIQQEPGAFIEFKGHIMMYLGSVNGKAYVIHDVYAYGESGLNGANGRQPVNCVNISDLYVTRKDGSTFISNVRNIVSVKS